MWFTISHRQHLASGVHRDVFSSKITATQQSNRAPIKHGCPCRKGRNLRSPNSIRHNGKRLSDILAAHEKFIRGDETGTRADLTGADLSRANLEKANLAYVNFHGAVLEGANLREAKLSSADLSKANLRRADLRKADLTEAQMSGADLTEARVGGAEMFRADLQFAILRKADFGATNFRDALVRGADFRGAGMRTAILRETNLDGADLSGVDLSTALLPRGFVPPRRGEKLGRGLMSTPWTQVEDYEFPKGWLSPDRGAGKARDYCQLLERGEILFFPQPPFDFPADDQNFLLAQQWAELRMHKNVSYRPADDVLRGVSGNSSTTARIHSVLRNYSRQVVGFLSNFLSPYSDKWMLDFASFRPFEEDGRDLPLHKRNDLLHVDAFPTRPTRGGRILRVFTNLNPVKPRVWQVTGPFESFAKELAEGAGLRTIAEGDSFISRTVQDWGAKLGIRGMGRTPYDAFMLKFHDYLKENSPFQANSPKVRIEFPPLSTWIVYTDGVAHAVMSGQYALEQTFLIPANALVTPEQAPYRILENIAGRPLIR